MDIHNLKKIVAREWLIFLIALFAGITISVFLYFMDSTEYLIHRKNFYEKITSLRKYDDIIMEAKMDEIIKEAKKHNDLIYKNKKFDPSTAKPLNNIFDQFDERTSINKLSYLRQKYPQYNDLDDYTLINKLSAKYGLKLIPIISYMEFNNILNDNSLRKIFYDSISTKYDIGDYYTFEKRVAQPTIYLGFVELFNHLFSRWYWLSTLFSILIPYLILQLIRSIYYSIRLLTKKNNTP